MKSFQFSNYRAIFQFKSFRNFWIGFAFSYLGDAMTRVALNWYVWEATRSAKALGLLTFFYLFPVVFGGLIAGWLLDRFDKRKVMLADNVLRGMVVALIPILNLLNMLEIWHIYVVAGFYGLLMMISLAGSPSIFPSLVDEKNLSTANALETFAFTLSNAVGPALAGVLIGKIGAPNVVAFDALTYFFFAAALTKVSLPVSESASDPAKKTTFRISDASNLLVNNKILSSTTGMFFLVNVGFGLTTVWLPIYADQTLGGGAELYGLLLGVIAIGEVLSSVLVGGMTLSHALGYLISWFQILAGISILLVFFTASPVFAGLSLFSFGFFHAPLTIWAQTLRMKIIPKDLRGRTFALLRMIMMSGSPLGGILAGGINGLVGIPGLILASGLITSIPGGFGLLVKELRDSDQGPGD